MKRKVEKGKLFKNTYMFILLITILLAPQIGNTAFAADDSIKIGIIIPTTGPTAGAGLASKASVIYTCNEINSKGGILGKQLKPIFRDEGTAEVSVRSARDLIENEGCKFIAGNNSSGNGQAVSLAVRDMKGKAFYVSLCASASAITEEKFHRYVGRVSHNTTAWNRCIADYAVKKWGNTAKRIFTLDPDYNFGHASQEEFVRFYKSHVPDAVVVGEAWPPLGTTDYASYVTKILSAKPDLLWTSTYGTDAVALFTQAAAYGLQKKIKIAANNMGLMESVNNLRKGTPAGDACIGVIAATPYAFYLVDNPESVKFYEAVYKESGWYPDILGQTCYAYLYVLKKSMETAKTTTDLEKIIDVWDQGIEIDYWLGKLKIRGCDHQAMQPFWVGTLGWDPAGKFPMPILTENVVQMNDYDALYHSCEEIKKIRASAK